MRLLILILLFPFITQGQIVRTNPYYRPTAAACSYLLDQYSGAAAAYSLRLLDCDYAGSAIRVRRSSDNTEQDIGFVNGNLDTATLKTFVGTGGTDDGFVVTWYDQSGNSRNATQATTTLQPFIMNDGVIYRIGSRPAVYFANTRKVVSSSFNVSGDISIFTTSYHLTVASGAELSNASPAATTGFGSNYHFNFNFQDFQNNDFIAYGNGYNSGRSPMLAMTTPITATTSYLTALFLGASSKVFFNNSEPTYRVQRSSSMSSLTSGWTIGGTANYLSSEFILYNSDKQSDRSGIQSNINTYYSIY